MLPVKPTSDNKSFEMTWNFVEQAVKQGISSFQGMLDILGDEIVIFDGQKEIQILLETAWDAAESEGLVEPRGDLTVAKAIQSQRLAKAKRKALEKVKSTRLDHRDGKPMAAPRPSPQGDPISVAAFGMVADLVQAGVRSYPDLLVKANLLWNEDSRPKAFDDALPDAWDAHVETHPHLVPRDEERHGILTPLTDPRWDAEEAYDRLRPSPVSAHEEAEAELEVAQLMSHCVESLPKAEPPALTPELREEFRRGMELRGITPPSQKSPK